MLGFVKIVEKIHEKQSVCKFFAKYDNIVDSVNDDFTLTFRSVENVFFFIHSFLISIFA